MTTRQIIAKDIRLLDSDVYMRFALESGPDGELARMLCTFGIGEGEAWRPLPGHQGLVFHRPALEVLEAQGSGSAALEVLEGLFDG